MKNIVKEDVVKWITKPENEELLKTLKLIKESSSSKDWYPDLDEKDKVSIKKGKKDHEEGRTLTSEVFWRKHE